jgi:hypothetical protein
VGHSKSDCLGFGEQRIPIRHMVNTSSQHYKVLDIVDAIQSVEDDGVRFTESFICKYPEHSMRLAESHHSAGVFEKR